VSLLTRRSRLLAGLMLGSLSLPAVAAELPKDVPANAWAATAVSNMVDKWRILGLSPEGTFDGHAEVSRYETAETLWRVIRLVERRQSVDLTAHSGEPRTFGDVEAQHEEAIEAVVNTYALMEGFPGGNTGRFLGHRGTTRYELAWMLHRLMIRAEAKQVAVTGRGPSLIYRDIPPGHWSGLVLGDLTQKFGLLIGFPDNTYRGDQTLRRYELAIAMSACLSNLLDKQLATTPLPVPEASSPTVKPAAAVAAPARTPLPDFESDYMAHVGRHEGRDLAAGLMLDMGWWFGKVGPTRPGFGLNADYSVLMNQGTQYAQSALGNAELRWRLWGSDFADEPYLYLSGGYHLDFWHGLPNNVPLLFGHAVGTGVGAGIPLGPWDLWLTGRWSLNTFLFPNESLSQRLSNGQQYAVALEKRWGPSALRLGYYGTQYQTFPTTGDGLFLPTGQGAAMLSGHFTF
jgi:hypothetical protein